MTTMSTGNVTCAPYTVISPITSRSIEVLTMPDVMSIVFVVDDDVSVRESLELLIRTAGWQPETFSSAQEFLSRPRATVPCCLVLDVTLPGLNGLELQQQLVDRTDMPIIFITGHGDVPMSVRAMKAGAVEFPTKPLKDDVLLNAIRGAIEHSRAAVRHASEMQALKDCYSSGREKTTQSASATSRAPGCRNSSSAAQPHQRRKDGRDITRHGYTENVRK